MNRATYNLISQNDNLKGDRWLTYIIYMFLDCGPYYMAQYTRKNAQYCYGLLTGLDNVELASMNNVELASMNNVAPLLTSWSKHMNVLDVLSIEFFPVSRIFSNHDDNVV